MSSASPSNRTWLHFPARSAPISQPFSVMVYIYITPLGCTPQTCEKVALQHLKKHRADTVCQRHHLQSESSIETLFLWSFSGQIKALVGVKANNDQQMELCPKALEPLDASTTKLLQAKLNERSVNKSVSVFMGKLPCRIPYFRYHREQKRVSFLPPNSFSTWYQSPHAVIYHFQS